jgi:hypothetical protein
MFSVTRRDHNLKSCKTSAKIIFVFGNIQRFENQDKNRRHYSPPDFTATLTSIGQC